MLSKNHMYTALNLNILIHYFPEVMKIVGWPRILKSQNFWVFLKIMFENYFNGEELLLGIPDDKKWRRVLDRAFLEYLALYTLLSFAWKDIKKGLSLLHTGIEKPGEALIYILQEEAKIWLSTPESKVETLYRAFLAYSSSDIEKLETYMRRLVKQTGRPIEECPEHYKFIEVCIGLSIDSKDPTVQKLAEEYQKKRFSRAADINAQLRKLW